MWFLRPSRRARQLDQISEQLTIMDHGLAQIFGVGLTAGMTHRHLVRQAIVGHQLGVRDREVGGTLLEVADWVTAGVHHAAQEFVGLGDRRARIVDEIRLDRAPALDVAVGLGRAQRPDVEGFNPLLALLEFRLRLRSVAKLVDGGDVLSPVVGAHLL
jgi:hypothetical protein